jgi:hypothetical protein
MNETFKIADVELERRRRAPLVAGLIWGLLAIAIVFFKLDSILYAFLAGTLLAAVMAFVSWRENRDFLIWAPTHHLVVLDDCLRIVDGAAESRLPYSGIHKVVVNMRLRKLKSVVLIRDNGTRERLPPYGNLALLIELLRKKLGAAHIEERSFVHV